MAAVSRPGSWWGAVSVVLVATGASLLACGALFVAHIGLEEAFFPERISAQVWHPIPAPTYRGSSLALLAAVSVLVAAAWRPDRWAPWLTRLGAPAARVYLPLSLSLLSLTLGGASVWFFDSSGHSFWFAWRAALHALSVSLALGLPAILVLRSTGLARRLPRLALPLTGLLLLAGGTVALHDSMSERSTSEVQSLHDFVDSFHSTWTLLEPLGRENAAGRGATSESSPEVDPSMVDTMVERPVRGAGERPVERRRWSGLPFADRSLDISLAGHPMTLDLTCAEHHEGDGCLYLHGTIRSPHWTSPPRGLSFDTRYALDLRQEGPGGRVLLDNERYQYTLDPASGEVAAVHADMVELKWRRQQPWPWRLAPLVALVAVVLLCVRRGAVSAWCEALRSGAPVRVRNGWVHGPDGFEAATELRDGPALLVEEVPHAVGYREASVLPAGVLVPGRQHALVERARLNVWLLDATALLVTSLLVAPVLAVALAQLVMVR